MERALALLSADSCCRIAGQVEYWCFSKNNGTGRMNKHAASLELFDIRKLFLPENELGTLELRNYCGMYF